MQYIGIDVGTSNTVVSWYNTVTKSAQALELLQTDASHSQVRNKTIPSAIFLTEENEPWFGTISKHINEIHIANRIVKSWKISLGTEQIFQIGPVTYKPYHFAKMLLIYIKNQLDEFFGNEDEKTAVFSLPASASNSMREDMQKAIFESGFSINVPVLFLDEPTAALNNFLNMQNTGRIPPNLLDLSEPKNIMVYDIGAGTVDVTIHKVYLNNFGVLNSEQISISRFNKCAGDTFDHLFVKNYLEPYLHHNCKISSEELEVLYPVLRNIAERTKIELCQIYSNKKMTGQRISYDSIKYSIVKATIGTTMHSIMTDITLQEYIDCVSSLLKPSSIEQNNIGYPIYSAINRANYNLQREFEIDAILFNGGMSYAPFVQDCVSQILKDKRVLKISDYATAVSQGAALIAYESFITSDALISNQNERKRGYENKSILAESLYLKESIGTFIPLIKQGTPLPFQNDNLEKMTVNHDTEALLFNFYKGDESIPDDVKEYIGSYSLETGNSIHEGEPLTVGIEIKEDKRICLSIKDSEDRQYQLDFKFEQNNSESSKQSAAQIKVPIRLRKPLLSKSEKGNIGQLLSHYYNLVLSTSVNPNRDKNNQIKRLESQFVNHELPFSVFTGIEKYIKNNLTFNQLGNGKGRFFFLLGKMLENNLSENLENEMIDFIMKSYEYHFDKGTRISIIVALGKSQNPDVQDFLMEILKRSRKKSESNKGLIDALHISLGKTLTNPSYYKNIAQSLNNKDEGRRINLLWCLARSASRETNTIPINDVLTAFKPIENLLTTTNNQQELLNGVYWMTEALDQRYNYEHGKAKLEYCERAKELFELPLMKSDLTISNKIKNSVLAFKSIKTLTGEELTRLDNYLKNSRTA